MKKNSIFCRENVKYLFPAAVTLLYFLFNLYLVLRHEPWRDEAQAWLIARDLSFVDMIGQLKFEGHPFLWYLLIAPFAKLGFPYITINFISLFVMTVAVWLVLTYFPVSKIVKLILVFSAGFVYYNSVIARNYCLIALFVVLLTVLYPHRSKHPIWYMVCLSLLMQTHVLILGFAGALIALFILEEVAIKFKTNHLGLKLGILLLPITSLFGLILQLSNSVTSNASASLKSHLSVITLAKSCYMFLRTILTDFAGLQFTNSMYKLLLMMIALGLIAVAIYYPKQIFVLLCGICWQCVVSSFLYPISGMQKYLVSWFVLLFCLTTMRIEKPWKTKLFFDPINLHLKEAFSVLLIVMACLSLPILCSNMKSDIMSPNSNSKAVAAFINKELPKDCVIVAPDDVRSTAVIPYLKTQRFWNPITQKNYTFVTWNIERTAKISDLELKNRITAQFKSGNVYLLCTNKENVTNQIGYYKTLETVKVFSTSTPSDESYYAIYRVKV